MRKFFDLFLFLFIFASCVAKPITPVVQDVTRVIEVTRLITEQNSWPSEMQFPAECLSRQPGVDYFQYDWLYSTTIGGCSFIVPSPNGRYIAYSTLICFSQEDCGEAVKVMGMNSPKSKIVQYLPKGEGLVGKSWVANISWSFQGDLVISHNNIDGGTGVYIYSEPFVENIGRGEKTVTGGIRDWNKPKTAFTTFAGSLPGSCDTEFSGYDFKSKKVFPDISTLLGLLPEELMIIPVDTNIKNANWWIDNSTIYLQITPLQFDEEMQDYKLLPTIAGKILITSEGPKYTTISSSSTEDFYFKLEEKGFSLLSKPYSSKYCYRK